MDPTSSIVNRLVEGIKEKTVQLAESKLKQTVSETPEEAILGIVASAVRSGAQRFETRVEGNDLVLCHDGRALTMADLCVLHRGSNTLPNLSKAFRLLLGNKQEETQIVVHLISQGGMHEATFKGFQEPKIIEADLNDLKLASLTTRIYLKGTGNYRRVSQAMGNELPEINLIRRRCFLAPLDIQVAGRALDRYTRLPESLVTGVNFHRTEHRGLTNIPMTPSQGIRVELGEAAPALGAINAGVCGIALNAAEAGWYQLVEGIARPLSEVPWAARTWGYVSLNSNAAPAQVQREIDLLLGRLTIELFSELRSLPAERAEDALSYLELQRSALVNAGHQEVDIDRAFLAVREHLLPSSDPKVMNSRLELASSLESAGKMEEAERLYREILPVWESEALNHFDKYRYEEGASVWQRALAIHEKLGTDPNEIADRYLRLAEIGKDQRLGFAEQSYRRCLRVLQSIENADKAKLCKTTLGLAEVLKKNRVLTEALRYAEEAEALQLELNGGKESKTLVPVLKLQAEIHDLMGDYLKSTEFQQKALLLKFKR